ncbi:MAG: hypothetical protein ACFFDS_06420 [Candidatus Thorarchaeota archaeon]
MSRSKDIPKTEDLKEEIKSMHRKWYENKILFISSLILWPPFFFGALSLGDWKFIPFGETQVWGLALAQTFMFFIAAGFFVLLLSYLFNQLWLLTLSGPKNEE